MKTVLVMRHAKSSWAQPELADHERPLKKRGQRDAPRMGQLVAELDLVPDAIFASTARRARETALAVAEACGYAAEVHFERDLYHAGMETFLELLPGLPDEIERVLVVGHNPDMEELVDWFTDESVPMPTAALAQIELPIQTWAALNQETAGRLLGHWLPRDLN